MHTYTANISRVCLGEISAFQMANLPSRDAYREVGAQRNPACPCVSLTSHRKRLFFFFFFADSAKCLHEANALCQILY